MPAILSYEPRRTFIESVDPDPHGYGRLTVSMLDTELPVSLLRYQTGDIVKILERDAAVEALRSHAADASGLPQDLLALQGREKERLPNGSHVAVYKDALYADPAIARQVTGAVRLTFTGSDCTVHVQLIPGAAADTGLTGPLDRGAACGGAPGRRGVVVVRALSVRDDAGLRAQIPPVRGRGLTDR